MEELNYKISLDGVPESTKEALLNPPVTLFGKALGGVFHYIFDPLIKFNIVRDYELKAFEQSIIENTNKIDSEFRDNSKVGLALKTLEDSKYQLGSEEIRSMFVNLLTHTLDNRTNHLIEPYFSSIIKEMSNEDARLFFNFHKITNAPSVTITIEDTVSNKSFIKQKDILLFSDFNYYNGLSVNSLKRLGLLETRNRKLSSSEHKARYENFKRSALYIEIQDQLPNIVGENFKANHINLICEEVALTPLGERFRNIVL